MLKDNLPVCPFCKKQLKYTESFNIHKKGEYYCSNCSNVSAIEYPKKFKSFAVVMCIIAIALCGFFALIGKFNIIEVIVVIIPFLILYYFVPYFIVLNKEHKEVIKEKNTFYEEDDDDMKEYTINKKKKPAHSALSDNDIEITKILNLK